MTAPRPSGHPRDAGSATLLVLMVVALAVTSLLAASRLTEQLTDHTRAATAADAAALAGVTGGRPAAGEAAERNGARLVSFRVLGADVLVEVSLGGARATARAGP